jgi:peptidoglycan/xylan/chitin deacetylase (PgdA/CDA1 family)
MTDIFISCDTELSSSLHRKNISAHDNFNKSIVGKTSQQDYGIFWQIQRLNHYGLKGVFFVDPMPALIYGTQIIADIVQPIIQSGHDVQMHIHTEWLEWVKDSPVDGQTGQHIHCFSYKHQKILIELARDILKQAGANEITAFRAGNYGANNDTLRALASCNIYYDSSFNYAYQGNPCLIQANHIISPHDILGVTQIPITGLYDYKNHFRPAQICAMSYKEMADALNHAFNNQHKIFMMITHSFEMLSRDRMRANMSVIHRYESILEYIYKRGLTTKTFQNMDIHAYHNAVKNIHPAPANMMRTLSRHIQQAWGHLRYE